MVLEASILVIDNSEWMRNGDYIPSRLEAQSDAVTLLFNAKTQSNPENTVGLMTMAGNSPQILVTLTSDIGKILTSIHAVQLLGQSRLSTGVQIASLALKHRQNKNQRQRIIVFVGSPIAEEEAELVKLGKKLKKNNVAVDVISFGHELEANAAKLEAFINAVNSSDNSHLVTIPPGPHIMSDVLLTSSIVAGENAGVAGASGMGGTFGGGGGFEFGVDPSLDPELALALRISMEEERARQQAAAAPAAASSTAAPATAEDEMLAQALAMSTDQGAAGDAMMLTEDEEIAHALQMSMETDGSKVDAAFVHSVLEGLPGVGGDKEEEKKKEDDKKTGGGSSSS